MNTAKKAYDLTATELDNSELSRLAKKAGYASLKAMLNDLNMWSDSIDEVEKFLKNKEHIEALWSRSKYMRSL